MFAQLFTVSSLSGEDRSVNGNGRAIERQNHERRALSERRRLDGFVPVVGTPRVLLIEPQDEIRLLYTGLLEEVGYTVYGVSEDLAAIRVAHQRLPDVVVMEMDVPGADGFEILSRLRDHSLTSNIPAIMVASRLHFDAPPRARASGAVLILKGPTGPEVLLAAVDELLTATPRDRTVVRQLQRSLLTLRGLGNCFKADERAHERVRGLIDRLQVAILVLDERGRYVAVSRGATMLTGYSRAELLGMSTSDVGLAPDPPLSGPGQEFSAAQPSSAGTTIRDKSGNTVNVQTAFATLLPGFTAAAFAISEHAAQGSQHRSSFR
jgi:two-component system, cell cycle response regulator CtrA